MSRTLHTNIRSYKEPFDLLITKRNIVNGIDQGETFKLFKMYGLILNKSQFINDNYNVAYKNTITIRLIRPNIDFKINDKICYRKQYYNIISVDYDLYSRNEIAINCEYLDNQL